MKPPEQQQPTNMQAINAQFDPLEDAVALELLGMAERKWTFYFDLGEHQHLLSSILRWLTSLGGKYSPFLDKNVSHLVTDKASTIAEAYGKAQKWSMKVWTFHQFLAGIERVAELKNPHLPPPSPTLTKASRQRKQQRDLSHYLEEERRQQHQQPKTTVTNNPRAITPLYAGLVAGGGNVNVSVTGRLSGAKATTATTSGLAGKTEGSKDPKYHVYRHPFLLIEEASYLYAPIQKEYPPTGSGRKTYPVLYWESPNYHCPFVQPPPPPPPPQQQEKENQRAVPLADVTRTTAGTNKPAPVIKQTIATKNPQTHQQLQQKQAPAVPVPRPKPGYCECCCEKYSDLDKHIQSEYHRRYAVAAENYSSVDQMIAQIKRPHQQAKARKPSLPPPNCCWPEDTTNTTDTVTLLSPARSTVSSSSLKQQQQQQQLKQTDAHPSVLGGKRGRRDDFECPVPIGGGGKRMAELQAICDKMIGRPTSRRFKSLLDQKTLTNAVAQKRTCTLNAAIKTDTVNAAITTNTAITAADAIVNPKIVTLVEDDEDDHQLMSSPSFKRRRSERIGARMAAGSASLFK